MLRNIRKFEGIQKCQKISKNVKKKLKKYHGISKNVMKYRKIEKLKRFRGKTSQNINKCLKM